MLDLSVQHEIRDSEHWSCDINQLYHPTAVFGQDSKNIIYSKDTINSTKFTPILLKEWFYLIEVGGYLVIDYKVSRAFNWQTLEKNMWWLWKNSYEVLYHNISNENLDTQNDVNHFIKNLGNSTDDNLTPIESNGSYFRFVCKKLHSTIYQSDTIDKWTFGIISNGKRDEYIAQIIKSILLQNIPHCEIIICGTYHGSLENVKYIPFNKRDKLGWISKKKNLIVEESKYENICMLHDRLVLGDDWYEKIKEWGNCFEHLGCAQIYKGIRNNDYLLHENVGDKAFGFASLLDYRDWDFDAFNAGQLHIAKRRFLKKNMWDESLVWGNPEDLDISRSLTRNGYILRNNPNVFFEVLTSGFSSQLPKVVYNPIERSSKREGDWIRIIGRKVYKNISKFKLVSSLMVYIANIIYYKSTQK